MDDPKLRMKAPEKDETPAAVPTFITITPEQLRDLVSAGRQDTDEFLQKQAQYNAEANKRLLRPENEQHPGFSAYRPNGRNGVELKCKMYWVGYPLDADTTTEEEISLLNQIDTVGEFGFAKTDGSQGKLTITGEKDANGKWTKLHFHFPCQGENRHNQPTMVALLKSVLAQMGVPA